MFPHRKTINIINFSLWYRKKKTTDTFVENVHESKQDIFVLRNRYIEAKKQIFSQENS